MSDTNDFKEADNTDSLNSKTESPDDLLNQAQAAPLLKKSDAWMERARWNGSGPPYMKVGRSVFYRRGELRDWLMSQRRTCTREVA